MRKIYLGVGGYVVCLDKSNGKEVWRTKLKTSTIVNVYSDGDKVFAHAGGHFFCLRAKDGNILWKNPLSGLGYGSCIIASEHQNASVVATQNATQQAAIASTAAVGAATSSQS